MNKYTLTEIIAAKKMAWRLRLYSTAAKYRFLELKEAGVIFENNSTFQGMVVLPQGMYIDIRSLRKSCK